MMAREGIVFYESFYQAVKGLNAEDFKECVTAILEYGLYGNEVEMSGVAKMFYTMAKPQIDANNKKYENGKKGGRKPKATVPPIGNQAVGKQKPTGTKAVKSTAFIVDAGTASEQERSIYAPDIEDVKSFIALKGLSVNAEEFYHHYDAVNWSMNGTHPDWRKLLMAWGAKAKDRQYNKRPQNTVTGSVFADVFLKEGGAGGN